MSSSSHDCFVFDLDNEEDAVMDDTGDTLSWRDDPNTNHSDWSIVIYSDGRSSTTYHVHKNVLSFGPRRSLYFHNVFSTDLRVSEQQDSTSRITLQPEDADVFPMVLDFMYSADENINIDRQNVVALRSLARYFQCSALTKRANSFIEADLRMGTAHCYIQRAAERNDDGLMETSRKFLCFHINRFSDEEHVLITLIACLPKDIFLFVMRSPELHTTGASNASRVVLCYFQDEPNELNAQLLCDLTHDGSGKPIEIAPSAALGFLDLISRLDSSQPDGAIASKLRALHDACVPIAATQWRDIDEQECVDDILGPTVERGHFGSRESAAALLCAAVKQAKQDYDELLDENNKLKGMPEKALVSGAEFSAVNGGDCFGSGQRKVSLLCAALKQAKHDYENLLDENNKLKEMSGKVLVSGAGLSAVNGTYIRSGTFDGVGKYAKAGSWQGEEQEFLLFRCRTSNNTRHWYISIVPDGIPPGTNDDIDFYDAPMSESSPNFPPSSHWSKCQNGIVASPRITMQFPGI